MSLYQIPIQINFIEQMRYFLSLSHKIIFCLLKAIKFETPYNLLIYFQRKELHDRNLKSQGRDFILEKLHSLKVKYRQMPSQLYQRHSYSQEPIAIWCIVFYKTLVRQLNDVSMHLSLLFASDTKFLANTLAKEKVIIDFC